MIYFVRHGESEANLKHVFAGQRDDSILTKKGEEQALLTAKEIKKENLKIDRIISSPLKRAFKTAEIIAIELGFGTSDITVDKRIIEYDMGELSGTPIHKAKSSDLISAEGAEDPKIFRERVISCIKELNSTSDNILLVSHAGVGRILETLREGVNPEDFYDIPHYENGSVTKIDWIR